MYYIENDGGVGFVKDVGLLRSFGVTTGYFGRNISFDVKGRGWNYLTTSMHQQKKSQICTINEMWNEKSVSLNPPNVTLGFPSATPQYMMHARALEPPLQ